MAITDKQAFFGKIQSGLHAVAVGDALGAGVEVMNAGQIKTLFGDNGVTHYVENELVKPGDITDDTSTTACAIMALSRTLGTTDPEAHDFQEQLLYNLHQILLTWVKDQKQLKIINGDKVVTLEGGKASHFIDNSVTWPDGVDALFHTPGAGKSTILSLCQGRMGTLEARPETGDPAYTYSNGCGGMIRILPMAVLCGYTDLDPYELGMQSAAVTHGDWNAIIATGLICRIMSDTIKHNSTVEAAVAETLSWAQTQINEEKNEEKKQALGNMIEAMQTALHHATPGLTPEGIDNANKVYFNAISKKIERFRSESVFLDALLTSISAERGQLDMKKSLQMAVNHSGDSDSVGAVCGGLLGVKEYSHKDIEPLYRGIDIKYRSALNAVLGNMSEELNMGNARNVG